MWTLLKFYQTLGAQKQIHNIHAALVVIFCLVDRFLIFILTFSIFICQSIYQISC